MQMTISQTPFSARGKILASLLVLIFVLLWLVSFYAYYTLPEDVPTHFGSSGKPTSYGSKTTFLILPFAFSIAPVIILVITRFRFTLINKYPYLINLPAFFTNISKIQDNRRSFWLNRYFELVLALGIALTIFFLVLLLAIYKGSLDGHLPSWFTIAVLLSPIALVVPFIYAMHKLSKQMKAEISQTSA